MHLKVSTTGVHPEMLHLQTELSSRRDKRLELARLRRDYEVVSVTKRRKLNEDGVWSWWKVRTRLHASIEWVLLIEQLYLCLPSVNAAKTRGTTDRHDIRDT